MSKNCPTLTTFNISVLFIVILCFFLLTWILINQTKDYYSQYDPTLVRITKMIKEKFKKNLHKDKNRENYSDINPSISDILNATSEERLKIMGRMIQNVKLCKKYRVKMIFSSFANTKYELRSEAILTSFSRILGI